MPEIFPRDHDGFQRFQTQLLKSRLRAPTRLQIFVGILRFGNFVEKLFGWKKQENSGFSKPIPEIFASVVDEPKCVVDKFSV